MYLTGTAYQQEVVQQRAVPPDRLRPYPRRGTYQVGRLDRRYQAGQIAGEPAPGQRTAHLDDAGAQMASGKAGFTGTLTIKMRRPTPLGERIDYEAGVDRVEGRKIWCWGKARCDSQLLAEAEGLFISPAIPWPGLEGMAGCQPVWAA